MGGTLELADEIIAKQPQRATTAEDFSFFNSLKNLDRLFGPLSCSICERSIQKGVKVRCLECPPDKNTTLCLECFRKGTENDQKPYHRKEHDFFIYDHLNFPLLVKDWTAAEELALISGIMKCGLGNWEDVHEQFLQHRTPQECEEHYFSVVYKSSS